MKIEEFIEHTNQLMAMGLCNIKGLPLVDIKSHAEKQIPKPPEYKVHEKYPSLGKNYYCSCGAMFVDFERNGTNYCGNCGKRFK